METLKYFQLMPYNPNGLIKTRPPGLIGFSASLQPAYTGCQATEVRMSLHTFTQTSFDNPAHDDVFNIYT